MIRYIVYRLNHLMIRYIIHRLNDLVIGVCDQVVTGKDEERTAPDKTGTGTRR